MMARLFIGGQFREADKVEPVIEAATGDPLGDGSAATESEIDDAVDIANDNEFGSQMKLGGGIGRELGPEGLVAYQTLKSIYRVGPSN